MTDRQKVAPVVVFAIGNPSRGDDAIGPVLYERLAAWLEEAGLAGQFDLYEDFQLQIEHALDLKGRQLALFIDAGENTPAPFVFEPVEAKPDVAHTSHALPPAAVLQVFRQIGNDEPPASFVLCVRGEGFALGQALSAAAMSHVEAAAEFLQQLCRLPTPAVWSRLADQLQAGLAA